ncbi:hypothetical protein NHX12_026212 [Muraenolepis orangiensis]|uniref:Meiosis-specific protein MEI4 n=1 Tax=Muraenolepis orangiensis TaxID=630683 RepID=A0A9Q0EJG7_9TELE|nr:hypothetical protein NHX12_026212 [Muraenolepis orangiensis]
MDGMKKKTSPHNEDTAGRSSASGWLVKKARLAAAVAVIKSRPPGVSGREHAEALAARVRSRDDGWRSRARELREEVLHLRQELLLAKMPAAVPQTGGAGGEASGDDFIMSDGVLSQDPTMDCDSGCGTETQLPHSDPEAPRVTCTPEGSSMHRHMRFLQSLCGLRRAGDRGGRRAWAAGPHPFCPEPQDSSLMADSLCGLLDSVVALVGTTDGPAPLPPTSPSGHPVLEEACRVLAGATDAWCLHRQPSPQFVAGVESKRAPDAPMPRRGQEITDRLRLSVGSGRKPRLSNGVLSCGEKRGKAHATDSSDNEQKQSGLCIWLMQVSVLMWGACTVLMWGACTVQVAGVHGAHVGGVGGVHGAHVGGVHGAGGGACTALGQASGEKLTEYLILLGESSLLRSLLVRHLLSLLSGLAQRLCQLCQAHTEHTEQPEDDVLRRYENSFYLFWVLEKLLVVGGGSAGPGCTQEHQAFLGLLGHGVLLLSEEFPLLSLYMWRVGALLLPSA